MPSVTIKTLLETQLRTTVRAFHGVSGGDINANYRLETDRGSFFLKTNTVAQAGAMFTHEAAGLRALARSATVMVPEIVNLRAEPPAYLVLDWIDRQPATDVFWRQLGSALARMHRIEQPIFGGLPDNYIGSLPQSNRDHAFWSSFYYTERLRPQMDLAIRLNRLTTHDLDLLDAIAKQFETLFPQEPPALIHGDLWSGNVICGPDHSAYLIDPAAGYAHREMDIAMSRLFGGFPSVFYTAYQEAYPLAYGYEEREPLYQLYYLLVHVNLFGGGYVHSVRNILRANT